MKWTSNEKNFLISNYHLLTSKKIADELKCSEKAVYTMAYRLGLRKIRVNHSITKTSFEQTRGQVKETLRKLKAEVSPNHLSYIAGLFDGDGFVTLKPQGKINPILKVGVANTSKDVLEWIREIFKFGQIYSTSRVNKQCYSYEAVCWDAVTFLELVSPYLRVKQKEVIEKLSKWLFIHFRGEPLE
jgi:hypothetical protein